ncbi:MAG: hypothetical protein IJQ81_12415 [Oscillibacter sp.]|nr:hypothetical protein [Oscillibacter sp.]
MREKITGSSIVTNLKRATAPPVSRRKSSGVKRLTGFAGLSGTANPFPRPAPESREPESD